MLTTKDQHPLQPTAHSRGPHDTEQAPNCPRCASTNTKFCYYNNYSLSQPRYFCKACRRYWTKGGSLRNVPMGGSYRRRRRATSSSSKPRPHHDHGSPYSFTSGDYSTSSSSDSASSNVEIDLAAVFANYVNPGSCAKTQRPADLPDRAGFVGADSPSLDESCFGLGMLQDELWCSSAEFANWEPMVDLRELDSPPLEPVSGVAVEDQLFQSDSMNQVMSDINWSCFDLEGYTSSFGN